MFFTFFMTAYWIFEIAGAKFIEPLTPFFSSVKDFIHIYYNRTTTVDTVQLDYSFLVFGLFLLIVTWFLKFAVEFVEDTEHKYDAAHRSLKDKVQERFNDNLEKNYVKMEQKNNNFVLMVNFATENMAKDMLFNHDADIGKEDKQKEVMEEFITNLSKSLTFQKRSVGEGAILFFHSVKNVDKVITEFNKTLKSLKERYKEQKWRVDYISAIETYSNEKESTGKCKNLLMLIKLNLKNELLCLSSFNHRYALLTNQQYFAESKGVYTINGEEDVFSIKGIDKQRKMF